MENFFKRLESYTEVRPTTAMTDIIMKIMIEVLSVLAIATKEIKQSRMKQLLRKFIGKTYIEGALRRLDRLTQEEARMSTSQVLKAIIKSMDEDTTGNESVAGVVYDGKDVEVAMQEKVKDVDKAKCSLSPKLISPYGTAYGSEKDDPPPLYTAPPTYGTPEIVSLLPGLGAAVETKDDKDKTTLDGYWDL